MKEIPLTRGYVALVDDEDYERVSAHKWHVNIRRRADGSQYVRAQRHICRADGVNTLQYMHRFVLEASAGIEVDHIDGDSMNNCRNNLRPCSKAQNMCNQRPQGCGTSRLKGVYWHKRAGKWLAQIVCNNKNEYLGLFTSEEEAGAAYNNAAVRLFGNFARLNDVGGGR